VKIEQINTDAMRTAVRALAGDEALGAMEALYNLINEAQADGYEQGYRARHDDMSSYQEGYEAAYDATEQALSDAYEDGFQDGKEFGDDGIREPRFNAEVEGFDTYRPDPETTNPDDAFFDGWSTGYDAGYANGYEEGVADAYDDGFQDGKDYIKPNWNNGMSTDEVAQYVEGRDYMDKLYADCEALDREMAQLNDAADEDACPIDNWDTYQLNRYR
jgi:flagellar biosynthesis/type III secretory pathway protein FliH